MDVKLQKGEWEGLGADERAKIQQIIAANFAEDVKVIPDAAVAAARQLIATRQPLAFNLSKPICAAACGVAEAAGVAACAALSGPAVAICVAAVHAAGDFCRAQC